MTSPASHDSHPLMDPLRRSPERYLPIPRITPFRGATRKPPLISEFDLGEPEYFSEITAPYENRLFALDESFERLRLTLLEELELSGMYANEVGRIIELTKEDILTGFKEKEEDPGEKTEEVSTFQKAMEKAVERLVAECDVSVLHYHLGVYKVEKHTVPRYHPDNNGELFKILGFDWRMENTEPPLQEALTESSHRGSDDQFSEMPITMPEAQTPEGPAAQMVHDGGGQEDDSHALLFHQLPQNPARFTGLEMDIETWYAPVLSLLIPRGDSYHDIWSKIHPLGSPLYEAMKDFEIYPQNLRVQMFYHVHYVGRGSLEGVLEEGDLGEGDLWWAVLSPEIDPKRLPDVSEANILDLIGQRCPSPSSASSDDADSALDSQSDSQSAAPQEAGSMSFAPDC
ncbi:hypothetical protein F5Y15DRAFT_217191 [Xylariaceae sp. FL0016]|nr:hypothetical protein F5Y15DRAFT_217191 [Xylariaceae sp. FL0016]